MIKVSDYYIIRFVCWFRNFIKIPFYLFNYRNKTCFYLLFKKRKKIKFSHYFIAGPITLIILLPHLIWLTENNYITITYGLQRTGGVGGFLDHLIYPLIF